MKILWFNWRDIKNPESGGAEVFTHEVAKRWVHDGNDVTLFTSKFNGSLAEENLDGVTILRDGHKYSVYKKAKQYYESVFNGKFDVVIDEVNTRPFLTPKYVKEQTLVTLIHQLAREYWFYETPFPVNVLGYYFLEKMWLRSYFNTTTITVSESTKSDLISMGFKKVHVIPEGLTVDPLEKLPEKEDRPTIIFVGRLKRAKLPDHALHAFKIIKKSIPNAQLWIVGDGYLRKDLTRNAFDGVTFFGRVNNEQKYELMKRAHVIMVPAVREGWGLVVTEANAMGTPAVAYNVNGIRDSVLDRETGLLVPYADINLLARTTIDVLTDHNFREELSINALNWAKNFSWDRTAEQFMDLISTPIFSPREVANLA